MQMTRSRLHRIRVFVSSTMVDLANERLAIAQSLERLGVFQVVRAEGLPAFEDPSQRVCLEEAAGADAVVLLVGDRYGYVPPTDNPEGLSVTHLEYRQARAAGRPVFAFVRRSNTRELASLRLLEDVGAFATGAFWKEWSTTVELTSEVERALVTWLARGSHLDAVRTATGDGVRRVAAAVSPVGVGLIGALQHDTADGYAAWREACATTLAHFARHKGVPIKVINDAAVEEVADIIRVVTTPKGRESFQCEIALPDFNGTPTAAVLVVVPADQRGARALAHMVAALCLLLVGEIPHGIALALPLLSSVDLDRDSRIQLLLQVAFASAIDGGASASDIARIALRESLDDGPVISAVTVALVQERARYARRRAYHAGEASRLMAIRLLTMGLQEGRLEVDALYNLARNFIESSCWLGFYDLLLRLHPEFEERWYVHRDIGLAYYHAGDYLAAAEAYQRAANLKGHDAQLFRWAGDAQFYSGNWSRAHPLYQRAVSLDDTEKYFVSDKIAFIVDRLRAGIAAEKFMTARTRASGWLTAAHRRVLRWGLALPSAFYEVVFRIWPLNTIASTELALRANRAGHYAAAANYLRYALAAAPENPSCRLNLVANLVFLAAGTLTDEGREQLRSRHSMGAPKLSSSS